MNLLSINIGSKGSIKTSKSGEQDTGIFKQPVDGPVQVTAEGLAGDYIANQKHHGGPDQAVYIYGSDDYDKRRAGDRDVLQCRRYSEDWGSYLSGDRSANPVCKIRCQDR